MTKTGAALGLGDLVVDWGEIGRLDHWQRLSQFLRTFDNANYIECRFERFRRGDGAYAEGL